MRPMRKLVLVTAAIFLVLIGVTLFVTRSKLPEGIKIDVKGQPTIGYPNARVHLVIFEEPQCSHCCDFNNEIFPRLKAEFIDTNKILYTVVPVAFMPNSMPAAVALLCVYNADPLYPNPDLFFTYLDYIYHHQPVGHHVDWTTTENLIEFAKAASPAINLQQLKKCIDTEAYRVKIAKNTEYGKTIMDGALATPTLYVNGIRVEEMSYDYIHKLIKEVLEHQGVR